MRTILKIGLRVLAVVAVIAVVVWFVQRGLRPEALVARAVTGTSVDAVTGALEVGPTFMLNVKAEVGGRVTRIVPEVGDLVKEGDLLVSLDATDARIQLEMRKIRLQAARDRLEAGSVLTQDLLTLQEEVAQAERMVRAGAMANTELERRQREVEKVRIRQAHERINAEEQIGILEQEVRAYETQVDRAQIYAPFDARVVEINVVAGDFLYPGNQVLKLHTPGYVVTMTIREEDFAGIEVGQRVSVRLAGYPGSPLDGEVDSLAPIGNADEKNRNVFVKVPNPPPFFVAGLTGEGILYKAQRTEATIIPRRALRGQYVYVLDNGNRVERRQVQRGFLSLNKAEILQGVEPGEWVILENQADFLLGQPVEPVPAE